MATAAAAAAAGECRPLLEHQGLSAAVSSEGMMLIAQIQILLHKVLWHPAAIMPLAAQLHQSCLLPAPQGAARAVAAGVGAFTCRHCAKLTVNFKREPTPREAPREALHICDCTACAAAAAAAAAQPALVIMWEAAA